MKHKRLAALLAAAAAVLLLAMPAFAADEQTELPASEAAEVQQEQTAAPAEQETALPADAQTDGEPEPQLTYVALGDSITAGVGLPGVLCTPTESGLDYSANFEGYPDQSYIALVAQGLGLDRQHAIDLGLPGLMSADLLDMVQNSGMSQPNQATGSTYTYPQFQDYLRKADIISIQIGSNDATVPCVMGLGEATHWKSEKLVELTVSGDLRNFSLENLQAMTNALRQLRLTPEETRDTNRLLFHGMDIICRDAYTQVTTNLPLILQEIRKLNPDATILLVGWYDPVPLLPAWNRYFCDLNRFAKELAAQQEGVTYVPVTFTQTSSDAHPTVRGHRYIANQILSALK